MTDGFALFANWSVRQKLNRVSSVQLRRSVRVFRLPVPHVPVRYIQTVTASPPVCLQVVLMSLAASNQAAHAQLMYVVTSGIFRIWQRGAMASARSASL